MPIPPGITRNHVLQAINRADANGVPSRRGPRRWAVLFNRRQYPCKLLISWGYEAFTGKELAYNSFVTTEAQAYLTNLDFNIVTY